MGGVLILLLSLSSCSSGPDSHTVTFSLNEGHFPEGYETTITVADGSTLEDIPNPEKDSTYSYRYAFAGWYADEALTEAYDMSKPVRSDLTLYAKWNSSYIDRTQYYTITFNPNIPEGAGLTLSDMPESITVKENGTATPPTESPKLTYTPSKGESITFSFVGWYEDAAYTKSFVFNTPITGNTELYAKWNTVVKPSDTASPTYYVFNEAGLNEWAKGGNTDDDCVLLADITLTKEWTPVGGDDGYSGAFDGGKHTISGLDIKPGIGTSDCYIGFFSKLTGSVENLAVKGSIDVTDNTNNNNIYAGGIAGLNNRTITNCTSAVTITISNQKVNTYAGCIAGANSSTITACYSDNASINAESISNDACAGGIAGSNESRGTITACYSIINEINGNFEGAIAGSNSGNMDTIRACYWSGNASYGVFLENGSTHEVAGDDTWLKATNGMNNVLGENFGWQWQTTDEDTPPTLVEKTN